VDLFDIRNAAIKDKIIVFNLEISDVSGSDVFVVFNAIGKKRKETIFIT